MLKSSNQASVAPSHKSPLVKPLCFLVDEDFVFRQELARALRQNGIEVVELSDGSRLLGMVEDQYPDIVFVEVKGTLPYPSVRTILALKECNYSGGVQLFGSCEPKTLDSFNKLGIDCSLRMLPPISKPVKVAAVERIIRDNKIVEAGPSRVGTSLKEALDRNWVTFLYQPNFSLKTKTMVGAEVVARVAHPESGLLAPDQFLKGADEEALLKLSRLVIATALKASAELYKTGTALLLGINIGVDTLVQLPIAEIVKLHRPDSREWPGILLEIPERQVFNRFDLLKSWTSKFLQDGVSIAIDNFCFGASRLDMLHEIRFAEIKLDRSLVDGCSVNEAHARTCKTFIQMAHNFEIRAAAVGLSNQADCRLIAELGCDIGQGFALSKPINWQELQTLITRFKIT
jgi:EAL domain-containing protein (putative c-di-GMP-specific phosphodiesterase class I)